MTAAAFSPLRMGGAPDIAARLVKAATRRNPFLLLGGLLVLPLAALVQLSGTSGLPYWLGYLLLIGGATFLLYRSDKQRAQAGGWRIAEMTLHIAELLGGWSGGFLAQRFLRHKTAKRSYQVTFWSIVALHQIVALDFLLEWRLARAALSLF